MNWKLGISALVLSAGLAYGQTGPTFSDDQQQYIPEERVQWALQQLQARQAARGNEATTQPVKAAILPDQPEDEVSTLRSQVASLRKQNAKLQSQIKTDSSYRKEIEKRIEQAEQTARYAQYSAQQALSALSYMRNTGYGGYGDSLNYPGGPVFTVPARGIAPQVFNPPAPGNALDRRFLFPNFAGPLAAPSSPVTIPPASVIPAHR